MIDKDRQDLFDIKLKGNDEDDITIANISDNLREIKKNFQIVNKLFEISKTISDPEDKTTNFLNSVILNN